MSKQFNIGDILTASERGLCTVITKEVMNTDRVRQVGNGGSAWPRIEHVAPEYVCIRWHNPKLDLFTSHYYPRSLFTLV